MSAATTERIAFDIETQPNTHRLHLLPEPDVALGNLKDPEKIREKEAAARQALIDKAALDANFGRIVCISFAARQGNEVMAQTIIRPPAIDATEASVNVAEAALLMQAWDQLAKFTRYATFNGASFDIPFMLRRSLLLNVYPRRIDCHPYRVLDADGEHLDVMKVLQEYETGNGTGYKRSLHFYARLILQEEPSYGTDLDKAGIGKLFDAGDYDTIRKVCSWDASATLRLAEAVSPVYC